MVCTPEIRGIRECNPLIDVTVHGRVPKLLKCSDASSRRPWQDVVHVRYVSSRYQRRQGRVTVHAEGVVYCGARAREMTASAFLRIRSRWMTLPSRPIRMLVGISATPYAAA